MSADYYDVLGVPADADAATIRRAYQKLARRYHPDIRPGDREADERFEEISRAYEVLADEETRALYDRGELPPAASPIEGGRRRRAPSATSRLEELVGVLVGQEEVPARDEGAARADVTTEVTLDLGEAVRGVTISLSVQREGPCAACGGDREDRRGCDVCAGRGTTIDLERLRVRIPPGVSTGSRLRVAGRGNRPLGAEAPGDLYVLVKVRSHPYFRRRGADIHTVVPITFAEAALGGEIEVPTVDGRLRVRVPPGTRGGQHFRLRGRGLPRPHGPPGDHYYEVRIVPPERLDDTAREALARLPREDPRADLPDEPL